MKQKRLLIALIPLLFAAACSNSKAPSSSSADGGAAGVGTFFTLEEKLSALSDDDLLNVCYRNNGDRIYDDEGKEIDAPEGKIKSLDPLDESVAESIKNDYFLSIAEDPEYQKEGVKKEQVSIAVYCGHYESYYAVRFTDLLALPAETEVKKIGGYNFHYPYKDGNEVVLWRPND